MHSDGPYMNKAYLGGTLSGAGCAVDSKMVDAEMERKLKAHHRVYEFWSTIQSLDNLQRSLSSLDFKGHDKSLNDLMDDLVKQWMKERRNALENS